MKTIANIAVILALLIGSVAFATPEEQQKNSNDNGWRARAFYAPTSYNVSDVKPVSIPVNPADAGFLHGDTQVVAGNGIDWYNFELGVAKAFQIDGWQGVSPVIGVDLQLSALSSQSDSSDRALLKTEQWSTETRDLAHSAFAYDKLNPGVVTPIPFIGLEINVGNFVIAPEIGLAYKQFKRESGYWRFGKFSPTTSKSEWAFSPRPLLRLSYKYDDSAEIGLFASYETYGYSFGRISGLSFGPTFALRF
jgi:opacity protein-like surface antigen